MRYEASPYEILNEDLEAMPAWFMDELHGSPAPDYISASWVAEEVTYGFCEAAEIVSLPRSKGILWRDWNAVRFIISPIVVEDEEEVKEREKRFREYLRKMVQNFGPWWEKAKTDLSNMYRPFQEADLKSMSNRQLARKIDDLRACGYEMCERHFIGMYTSWELFLLPREFCRNEGVDIYGEEFNSLVKGYDNDSYKQERELYYLAVKAKEMGFAETFKLPEERIIEELQREPKGKEWLKDFEAWQRTWGWKLDRCWWLFSKSWMESPVFALAKVKEYMKLDEVPLVARVEEGKKDKERAIEKLKEKIPPEKRSVFCELVEAARYVDIFSEEHNVYCEFPNDSVRRLYILEAGRRLVNEGAMEKVDDVFMLWIDEIKKSSIPPEAI